VIIPIVHIQEVPIGSFRSRALHAMRGMGELIARMGGPKITTFVRKHPVLAKVMGGAAVSTVPLAGYTGYKIGGKIATKRSIKKQSSQPQLSRQMRPYPYVYPYR